MQLGLADPEDFANERAFLCNRWEGAHLFTLLEASYCTEAQAPPHWSLPRPLRRWHQAEAPRVSISKHNTRTPRYPGS